MGYGSNEFNVQRPTTLLLCVKTPVDDSHATVHATNLTPASASPTDRPRVLRARATCAAVGRLPLRVRRRHRGGAVQVRESSCEP